MSFDSVESNADSVLQSFAAFWNMPMISEYISHAFLFSMGERNNERLSCEQGFFWEDDFQLISACAVSASHLTLLSCCVRQQTSSHCLQQRVIMEEEMERNVQQWSVYVCIYLFNPGHECLQLIRLSPFGHGTLRGTWLQAQVEALLTPARLKLGLSGKRMLKALFGDEVDYRTCLPALQHPQIRHRDGEYRIPGQKCIVSLNILGENMSMIYFLPSASQQQPGHLWPFLVLLSMALITAISGGLLQSGHCH